MNIQELHIKSIEIADVAFIKKFKGQFDEAKQLFRESFLLEQEAAYAAKQANIAEPSLSVLFKSAAALAINCDEFLQAEKLICTALVGEPPFEIAEELRNLLEDVYFQRHLQLQGITLNSNELQLVIAGKGIGYGMAKSDLIFNRINTFEQIAARTMERKMGKPFRNGSPSKIIKMNSQTYLSVPRAASFAYTIRIGGQLNSAQSQFEGFQNSVEVIEDIVENISLVNNSDYSSLKDKIIDETYFNNFIALTKELAPDGDDINLVGLSILRNGKQKDVQFTKVRKEISSVISDMKAEAESNKRNDPIELVGRLFAANEDENKIRLKLEGGISYSVSVPDGLNDIVKNYWGEQVKIKAKELKPRAVKLLDIDPA